jgi:hypothetical protein
MTETQTAMEKILIACRQSWPGQEGEERAARVKELLESRLENYSRILGIPRDELLAHWERDRNYSAVNYYQEANFPLLSEDILIFETEADFFDRFPSKKSVCPSCRKETKGYFVCEHCNWSAGGLFGTLNDGVQVLIKASVSRPHWIFTPIEMRKEKAL